MFVCVWRWCTWINGSSWFLVWGYHRPGTSTLY